MFIIINVFMFSSILRVKLQIHVTHHKYGSISDFKQYARQNIFRDDINFLEKKRCDMYLISIIRSLSVVERTIFRKSATKFFPIFPLFKLRSPARSSNRSATALTSLTGVNKNPVNYRKIIFERLTSLVRN